MIPDGTKVYGIKLLVLSRRSNELYHYAIYTRLLWLQLWNDCSVLAWVSLALVGLKLCNRTIESDVYVGVWWIYYCRKNKKSNIGFIPTIFSIRMIIFVPIRLKLTHWWQNKTTRGNHSWLKQITWHKSGPIKMPNTYISCSYFISIFSFHFFLLGEYLADYSPSEFLENLQISVLCYLLIR